jgi:hypothetical protein
VELNTEKEAKIMASQEMEAVAGKISINDRMLEHIDTFSHLEYRIFL